MRTDGRLSYLGYEVTRAGLQIGRKARWRLRQALTALPPAPRLAALLAAYRSVWMFASGQR